MLIFRMKIANSFVSLESHRYGLKGDLAWSTQWKISENHHWILLNFPPHVQSKCTDALNFSLLTLGQYGEDWIDFAFGACFPAGRRRRRRRRCFASLSCAASCFVAHTFRSCIELCVGSSALRFAAQQNHRLVSFSLFSILFCAFVRAIQCVSRRVRV